MLRENQTSAVINIISEVLDLPKEKQEELNDLLEKTTLKAIINTSKIVVARIDFLADLDTILFDEEFKWISFPWGANQI